MTEKIFLLFFLTACGSVTEIPALDLTQQNQLDMSDPADLSPAPTLDMLSRADLLPVPDMTKASAADMFKAPAADMFKAPAPDMFTPVPDMLEPADMLPAEQPDMLPPPPVCGGVGEACCPSNECTGSNRCMRHTSDGATMCFPPLSCGGYGYACCLDTSGGQTYSTAGWCIRDDYAEHDGNNFAFFRCFSNGCRT